MGFWKDLGELLRKHNESKIRSGSTEPIIVNLSASPNDPDLITRAVHHLVMKSNELGLEGKKITSLCREPSFSFNKAVFSLNWEERPK